jgi:hypothetical protein
MFKKTLLIITSTILITQLAGFYEKNYIGENFNRSFHVSINKEENGHEHLDNKSQITNKKTSPKLYKIAEIANQDSCVYIPLYTMLNMKSSNLIANS